MILPLMILGLGAICYGFLSRDLIIGLGSLFFNTTYAHYTHFNLIDSEFLDAVIKNIPFVFTVVGALASLFLINCFNVNKDYVFSIKMQPFAKILYTFLNKKWFFDQIVNEILVVKLMNFGYFSTFQSIDKGFIEKLGPTGFTFSLFNAASSLSASNSGFVSHTIFFVVASVIVFLNFLFSVSFSFF
jgi:NADH-ubiquinone oxidoreductase chain 5